MKKFISYFIISLFTLSVSMATFAGAGKLACCVNSAKGENVGSDDSSTCHGEKSLAHKSEVRACCADLHCAKCHSMVMDISRAPSPSSSYTSNFVVIAASNFFTAALIKSPEKPPKFVV